MLAYFVSGFFYMVGLRLCDALSRCRHFWVDMTSQGVIDLYHYPFGGPTHVILLRSYRVWESDRVVKRHEGHAWYWLWTITMWIDDDVSMILRGIAAPPIIARPLDIWKYLYLAKKGPIGWKLLCWHWLCICIMLGAIYCHHRWTNKKPLREKNVVFYVMMCTSSAS